VSMTAADVSSCVNIFRTYHTRANYLTILSSILSIGEIFYVAWKLLPSKLCYRIKKDVLWMVIGRVWSRDHTWVRLMWL